MLDAKITPFIKPLLKPLISFLDQQGVAPNHVTLAGFVLGLLAVPFIILNWWWGALCCIIFNRVLDGLDGELARYQKSSSSAGGYLDICLDFLFYAFDTFGVWHRRPYQLGYPCYGVISHVYWYRK